MRVHATHATSAMGCCPHPWSHVSHAVLSVTLKFDDVGVFILMHSSTCSALYVLHQEYSNHSCYLFPTLIFFFETPEIWVIFLLDVMIRASVPLLPPSGMLSPPQLHQGRRGVEELWNTRGRYCMSHFTEWDSTDLARGTLSSACVKLVMHRPRPDSVSPTWSGLS